MSCRIYVNEKLKLSFFLSELDLHQTLHKSIAELIIDWATKNQCKMVISAAGLPNDNAGGEKEKLVIRGNPGEEPSEIYALTSTKGASKLAKQQGFLPLRSGMISGIPATLLNEGSLIGLDVIVLLVKTQVDGPDFRGAAAISNAITKLIQSIYCDIGIFLTDGEAIETKLRQIRECPSRPS